MLFIGLVSVGVCQELTLSVSDDVLSPGDSVGPFAARISSPDDLGTLEFHRTTQGVLADGCKYTDDAAITTETILHPPVTKLVDGRWVVPHRQIKQNGEYCGSDDASQVLTEVMRVFTREMVESNDPAPDLAPMITAIRNNRHVRRMYNALNQLRVAYFPDE